jgi:hypothetical protein
MIVLIALVAAVLTLFAGPVPAAVPVQGTTGRTL